MDFFTFVSEQWLLVSVLLALIYLYVWMESRRGGQSLSIHEATRMINDGKVVVVDLRESKEYKQGHIVDSINLPHNKLNDQLSQLDNHKEKTVLLIDKMGQHSGGAGRVLKTQGFEVCRLQGGITEWQNQKLPLVK